VQAGVDGGQPDVDDEHVDDGHQLPGEDDREQCSRPDGTALARPGGAPRPRPAVVDSGARWLAGWLSLLLS
jgi:hypothetical protein